MGSKSKYLTLSDFVPGSIVKFNSGKRATRWLVIRYYYIRGGLCLIESFDKAQRKGLPIRYVQRILRNDTEVKDWILK